MSCNHYQYFTCAGNDSRCVGLCFVVWFSFIVFSLSVSLPHQQRPAPEGKGVSDMLPILLDEVGWRVTCQPIRLDKRAVWRLTCQSVLLDEVGGRVICHPILLDEVSWRLTCQLIQLDRRVSLALYMPAHQRDSAKARPSEKKNKNKHNLSEFEVQHAMLRRHT